MSSAKMNFRWTVRRTQRDNTGYSSLVSNNNGYTTEVLTAYEHISLALEGHDLEAESYGNVHDMFRRMGGIYAKTYEVDGGSVMVLMYTLHEA